MDTKIILTEKRMPQQWYNIQADLPKPLPPSCTRAPASRSGPDLAPLFPMELSSRRSARSARSISRKKCRDSTASGALRPCTAPRRWRRPWTPPPRSTTSTRASARAGSHKPNTAVAQAYYNKKEGIKRLTTETGAGQWGSSLAFACSLFGLECKVYMVQVSYEQKPYRRMMMEAWGAKCVPSPSTDTNAGRAILAEDPNTPGSLGIAISEAVEDAANARTPSYSLGSVLNHVLLHQTVIGQEAQKQMEMAGEYPDIVIACVGGGSNFGGIVLPFVRDKINRARRPASSPSSRPPARA